jgi:hypothetical protein
MNLRIETNFVSEAKPGSDEIRERESLLFQGPETFCDANDI